jgi:hypothetical protein
MARLDDQPVDLKLTRPPAVPQETGVPLIDNPKWLDPEKVDTRPGRAKNIYQKEK